MEQSIFGLKFNIMKYILILILFLSCSNRLFAQACITLTEPSVFSVSCSKIEISSNNGNDGSVTANVSGGTSPYTYLWSNGATTSSITNLSSGSYEVTVTDKNNCITTCNTVLNGGVCNLPNAGKDTALCDLFTLNLIPAGIGQAWNSVAGNPSNATINSQGLIVGMTNVGVYKFYLSAGTNCNDTVKVIRQNSFNKGICAGDTYELKTQSNLTNIKWYRNGNLLAASTSDTIIVRISGTYTYEGLDANGCLIKLCCPAIFVDSTCCITPNAGNDQILSCNGNIAPTIASLGVAPIAYTWYVVTQPSGANALINNTGAVSNMLISGNYIFELRSDSDANCKDSVRITVPNCSVPCPSPNCRYTSVRKL